MVDSLGRERELVMKKIHSKWNGDTENEQVNEVLKRENEGMEMVEFVKTRRDRQEQNMLVVEKESKLVSESHELSNYS